MQKLFIPWLSVSVLFIGGCSTLEGLGQAIPDAVSNTSLVYKPEIQQGNVITQEMVDKLEPGMTRRQVAFVLGTPLLVDTFHQDRWDYIYTREVGGGAGNKQSITLLFEDDVLTRIEGDFRPVPKEDPLAGKETVFSVPDYNKKDKGFFERTLNTMGIDTEEQETTPSAAGMEQDKQLPEMDKDNSNELPQTVEEAQESVEEEQDGSEEPQDSVVEGLDGAEEEQTVTEEDQNPDSEDEEEEKGFFSRAIEAIGL